MSINLNKLINLNKKNFDLYFKNLLKTHLLNDKLSKAMFYASINGGKRIRPFLINIFSNIASISISKSLRLSAVVELIHSYSLIHDDLPSMDNDDFRRGKLSTHKKFDEATAILAGDALHDLAFEILADKKTHTDANIRVLLVSELSKALGFRGLAGGQSLDLIFENKKINSTKILNMYKMKTAALFRFSCVAPFILAKKNNKEIYFANKYGELFGLIFQIIDDVLDEKENFKKIGKTPGKDKKQGKSTLVSFTNNKKLKIFCINEINNFKFKNRNILSKYEILEKLIYFNIDKLN